MPNCVYCRLEMEKDPIHYIKSIHNTFLREICDTEGCGFEGIEYYGGPEVTCCKESKVLHCVKSEQEGIYSATPLCESCRTTFIVNDEVRMH